MLKHTGEFVYIYPPLYYHNQLMEQYTPIIRNVNETKRS